ncbi:MAG: malonyl CoA-ACP transacylase, partial [Deltaproteobacteria bacterium]|nr:malonyl CoA-ACP transacylase [Deltaproteobacteria bacterium]
MKAPKSKTAFCFPGQLQERPTWEDFHPLREDSYFKEYLTRTFTQTQFDLLNFSFGGEEKEEDLSLKLQLSAYTLSMVHFYRLRAAGWVPDIFAEHSMGIYSALAASEAISFEEGLFVTEAIGRLLKREGAIHPGGMASIIGLSLEEIQKICQDLNGFQLSIANYNGSMHFVLS